MFKADSYKPLSDSDDVLEYQYDAYRYVWKEADELRKSGALLEIGRKIKCPVIVIHGDYDPHPAEGVYKPLSTIIRNFRFIGLEKCGHYPWREKQASEIFYKVLNQETAITLR